MEDLKTWFVELPAVWQALIATTFTWLLTAFGASFVFLFTKIKKNWFNFLLGFTGGIMIAASYWSLLAPAIAMSENLSVPKWFPAAIGFISGALFLFSLDKILPHLHINFKDNETEGIKTDWQSSTLLVLAITLHNIPEGLAVGVAFGAVAAGIPNAEIGAAIALTIGIALQNFPEGIAVAMPLRAKGLSRFKSFWYGQLSAIVEPVAGVIGALSVMYMTAILPYALAFAAGAMIFVVIEEVVPESQKTGHSDMAALGFTIGFVVMMILDVGLS